MTKRMAALSIVAALGIAAIIPATASAATFSTHTTIAINSVGNGFAGKVTSPRSSCVPSRHVTLQRKLAGHTSFSNVGSDVGASNGTWNITSAPVANAQYRAKVASKAVAGNTCAATTSTVTSARATSVSIVQAAHNFHGKVNSVSACVPNRKVTLYKKGIYSSTFSPIGSDVTDSAGNWLVSTTPTSGASYRAKAGAKQAGANSCMVGQSHVVVAS